MATVEANLLHGTCPGDDVMNGIESVRDDPFLKGRIQLVCIDENIKYEHRVPLFPHLCTSINHRESQFLKISCMGNIAFQNFPSETSCVSVYSGYNCEDGYFMFNINQKNSDMKGFRDAISFKMC